MPDTDPLIPVYDWLIRELHFPYDISTRERPAWLDVRVLAARWAEYEGDTDSVEDYVLTILGETRWEQEGL